MKRARFLLFLTTLVIFAVIEHDPIVKAWTAMYPSDRNKKTALSLCYAEDHQFSRASAAARADCYEKWLPILSYTARHGTPYER
jgi:hypothetical protein